MNIEKFLLYFVIICIGIGAALGNIRASQATDFSNLSFSSGDDSFRIFDRTTGKIYMYSSTRGDLYRVYRIDELGKNLIKESL